MSLEIFKKDFIDRLFPREMREAKVEEFVNLVQGDLSVLDYSLNFTKLSKYDPSLVSNPRDEMSHFLMGCTMTWLNNVIRLCFMII